MLFELDAEPLLARDLPAFAALPRQQSAWRDIAVIAGEGVTHAALMATIEAAPTGGLVRSARLFDLYKPTAPAADMASGDRSLAVRLELRDDESTLTDERIGATVAQVLAALNQRLGVRLRG